MIPYEEDDRIRIMISEESGMFVDLQSDHGHYQINLLRAEHLYQDELYNLISLGLVILSFFAIYIILRNQLKPIRALHEGVREIGEGNLDFEIKTNSVDELGQLALSFNQMTRQIRESLQARDQLLLGREPRVALTADAHAGSSGISQARTRPGRPFTETSSKWKPW